MINPAPGAWFLTIFISLAHAQYSLTLQSCSLKHHSFNLYGFSTCNFQAAMNYLLIWMSGSACQVVYLYVSITFMHISSQQRTVLLGVAEIVMHTFTFNPFTIGSWVQILGSFTTLFLGGRRGLFLYQNIYVCHYIVLAISLCTILIDCLCDDIAGFE